MFANYLKLLAFVVLLLAGSLVKGQTYRSVNNPPNNLWNDPNTWDQGAVPGPGDNVQIRNNDTVVVNSAAYANHVTLRGNARLVINSGDTLYTTQDFRPQGQNQNGNTTEVVVNGRIMVGDDIVVTARRKINYRVEFSGSGQIFVTDDWSSTFDTTGGTIDLALPITMASAATFQSRYEDGELSVNLASSFVTGHNFMLRSRDGADSSKLIFDMRNSGAVLSIGNNLNFRDGGGFILNDNTVTDIYHTTFNKIKFDDRITYHHLHLTGTGNANSDREFTNVLGSLFIDNGATLTTNRRSLRFTSCDLVVNGTVATSSGDDSLIFNGSSAQTISGSGTATFETMVVDNASGVSNSVNLNVTRFLCLRSGAFNTGNSVTLKSTSTRTAYLLEIGNNGAGASISGTVKCERNITGTSTTGYRNLSSPVQGTTLLDYQEGTSPIGFYTYGYTGSTVPSSIYNSSYQYDPAIAISNNDEVAGWVAATSTSNSVTPYKAWTIYCGGTQGAGAKQNYDLSTTGTPYTGSIVMNSTNANLAANTGGVTTWGFIGNPYASAIEWSRVTKSGVAAVAQIYGGDDFNGYRTTNYNASANRIPPFQGFWVQTTAAGPSITFEEEDKVTNNISFRKSDPYQDRLYLELRDTSKGYHVGACIDLNDHATRGFDVRYDGLIFENPWPYPNLYFPVEDTLHAQVYSVMPDQALSLPVKVYASKGQSGTAELEFTQLPKRGGCFTLEDKLLNKSMVIDKGMTYSFNLADSLEDRFVIHYSPGVLDAEVSHLTCFDMGDGKLEFQVDEFHYDAILLDSDTNMIPLTDKNGTWVAENLSAGNYQLRLESIGQCSSSSKFYSVLQPTAVESSFNTTHLNYEVGEEVHFENESSGASNFLWSFGNNESSFDFEPVYSYDKPGEYTVWLAAHNGNVRCVDSAMASLVIDDFTLSTEFAQDDEVDFQLRTVSGGYELHWDRDLFETIFVEVFDLNGKPVSQTKIDGFERRLEVDLPQTSGIYVLVVYNNELRKQYTLIR